MKFNAMNTEVSIIIIGMTDKRVFRVSEISAVEIIAVSMPVPNMVQIRMPTSIFTVCSRSSMYPNTHYSSLTVSVHLFHLSSAPR